MALTFASLPDDLDTVKRIAVHCSEENDWYREQLRLLKALIYGRKSEQVDPLAARQLRLFEDLLETLEDEAVDKPAGTPVRPHVRSKPGRRPLPEHLPRVTIVHDVAEADKRCGCGAEKPCIGQEVSEQLEYEPARLYVVQHVRPKYACRKCEGVEDAENPTVVIAPPPPQIIPKGIPAPGLLAQVMTAKFADAIPFYRQERQFERLGVEIGRASMCNWALKVGEACAPLIELLHQEILAGSFVGCDESRLQVLDEPGRDASDESYVWVFRGGAPGKPVVVFLYSPSRGGEVPKMFLQGFQGSVQCDGYIAYDPLERISGIVLYGCWAHARRKFVEVIKAAGRLQPVDPPKGGVAEEAVERIRLLYAVEASARERELSAEETVALRQEKSKPVLDSMKTWLEGLKGEIRPTSLLGRATFYTLNQWPRLEGYVNNGLVRIDNNLVENAIRPYALGRKNWLFSGTPEGAHASTRLFTLIETAKANGLEPYRYLHCLFRRLPLAVTTDDLRALLPQYIDRAILSQPP